MKLFDPLTATSNDWPAGAVRERAYIEAVARAGPNAMASNVRTRWLALRSGERLFPITVNDGERGDSYVCLPHSAYALYALREMELIGARGRRLLAPAARLAGRLLLAAGIDRIVHLDNWLLSTNLHGNWDGADLPAIRALLAKRFPRHVIAIRSVDDWSSPALAAAARVDGWVMTPARQIWVTDDLARDWLPRHAHGNDRRLLARSGLSVEDLVIIVPSDAERIADLYRQLYIGKYSALNPAFTPAFVAATHASGLIRYRVARDAGGVIMAVAGLLRRGGVATPPVVGYDTTRPRSDGLYRVATWLFSTMALEEGVRLHGSAGAAHFKRLRGAHGVIEYWAMHVAHLPRRHRLAVQALAAGLERCAVPMMQRRGL